MKTVINSDRSLKEAQGLLGRLFKENKYVTIAISTGKRSLNANSLSHVWYLELSRQGGDSDVYYKSYAKYTFGMAILTESEPEYVSVIRKAFSHLSYEERIIAMQHIDVTSRFNRKQMSEYMEKVKLHFESEGFILTEG